MTVLSDVDIKREMGRNIIIFPYRNGNLKGATYNLTASRLAWNLSTKQSIYNESTNRIIIPPRTTALIETYETIWVSQKICGTYHSKVYPVSRGTGHIGTTLDPNYKGPSLIAVHNHSDDEVAFIPEDPDHSFVTITFHYVYTASSIEEHGNYAGRIEILGKLGIRLTEEEERFLSPDFRNIREAMKREMEKCPDYQEITQQRESRVEKSSIQKLYIFLGIILAALLLTSVILSVRKQDFEKVSWYTPINFTVEKSIEAVVVVWITLLTNRILNKQR